MHVDPIGDGRGPSHTGIAADRAAVPATPSTISFHAMPFAPFPDDAAAMGRALDLARGGVGRVEPNPPVGAVLTTPDRVPIAEGYHRAFGGPHSGG